MDLHGASIRRLIVDWEAGALSIIVRAEESDMAINASGLRRLTVVWAHSGAANRPIDRVDVGHEKLNIEIQGGGHVSVQASSIEMPDDQS
jgi:hypothetical protein